MLSKESSLPPRYKTGADGERFVFSAKRKHFTEILPECEFRFDYMLIEI